MIKHNEKHLEQILENIAVVKDYSSKLSELQSTEKDAFWGALKKIVTQSIKAQTEQILSILNEKNIESSDIVLATLKFRAGCISTYKEMLELVDNNDNACAEASARLKELNEKAKEIQANIDLQ